MIRGDYEDAEVGGQINQPRARYDAVGGSLERVSQFFFLFESAHNAKNWLFLGNAESGNKCAILYTIVENCRRLGINTREYLQDVLTRLPAMNASEAAALIPAKWLAARSAKAARPAA